jgi:hypothetical protein
MNLDLDSILWSTRGYNWGFRFPLQPQKYGKDCQDWLGHYEKMFEPFGDDDNRVVNGYLNIDNKEIPFIAVRFKDPEERKDISGRIIPHEVAIIGDDTQNLINLNSFELQNAVWFLVSDTYSKIYQASYQDLVAQQAIIDDQSPIFAPKDEQHQWQELKLNFIATTSIIVILIIGIAYAAILNNLHRDPPIKSLPNNKTT